MTWRFIHHQTFGDNPSRSACGVVGQARRKPEMRSTRSQRLGGQRMADVGAPSGLRAETFDRDGIGVRLDQERRRASLLGDMREAIFGAQDGLVSTLAVVSTVSGATDSRFTVLIAGIATALAGIFSMAAGEYLSSKSQREIALAQIRTSGRSALCGPAKCRPNSLTCSKK